MSFFDDLQKLIKMVLEQNKTWTYRKDVENDLMSICTAADHLLEDCDSYAYEVEVDDQTGKLIISFEDCYCGIKTGDDSVFYELISYSESVTIVPLEKGMFKMSFIIRPIFEF